MQVSYIFLKKLKLYLFKALITYQNHVQNTVIRNSQLTALNWINFKKRKNSLLRELYHALFKQSTVLRLFEVISNNFPCRPFPVFGSIGARNSENT